MNELLCHLVGDYVLQNHWMANNKTREWIPAIVHAALYSLPFLLLTQSAMSMSIIFGTHLVIDRFRLARLWVEFYGVGNSGTLWHAMKHDCLPWESRWSDIPQKDRAPDWLGVWLLIIVDNTLHLAINHFALRLCG